MPNKRAATKDLRKSKKRRESHVRIQANLKFLFRQTEQLLKSGKLAEAAASAAKFQQAADKAAKRRAVSTNRADRKKSQIMKAIASRAS
jgi:ribosomal protein S20